MCSRRLKHREKKKRIYLTNNAKIKYAQYLLYKNTNLAQGRKMGGGGF